MHMEFADLSGAYAVYCINQIVCQAAAGHFTSGIIIDTTLRSTSPEALAAVLAHEGTHAAVPAYQYLFCIANLPGDLIGAGATIQWEFDGFKNQVAVWKEVRPARKPDDLSALHDRLAGLNDDELLQFIQQKYPGLPDNCNPFD